MREFADVVVSVPEGMDTAVIEMVGGAVKGTGLPCGTGAAASRPRAEELPPLGPLPPRRPPGWLPIWHATVMGLPAAVLVGLVEHISPMGPTAAAGRLAFNWWLH